MFIGRCSGFTFEELRGTIGQIMRREGEEKLRSLGSGLTKVKKNFHKKRAAMLRNKTDFTGKKSAVGKCDSHNL